MLKRVRSCWRQLSLPCGLVGLEGWSQEVSEGVWLLRIRRCVVLPVKEMCGAERLVIKGRLTGLDAAVIVQLLKSVSLPKEQLAARPGGQSVWSWWGDRWRTPGKGSWSCGLCRSIGRRVRFILWVTPMDGF